MATEREAIINNVNVQETKVMEVMYQNTLIIQTVASNTILPMMNNNYYSP